MHNKIPKIFIFIDRYNNKIFQNNNTDIGIVYRNYNNSDEKELFKIVKAFKKKRFKLYVSNNIKLAIKVNADGIYIPSFNKTKRYLNIEKKNLTILGSAHNQQEIYEKKSQNCKGIFLAPTFYVNKRNYFHGVHKFNYLSRLNKTNFFALGGIDEKSIIKLKLLNAKGFGAISLFKKKPAFKGRFF